MIAPTKTLLALPLRTGAGDYRITDFAFDPATGRAPFLIIDMGGLLSHSHATVQMSRITGMSPDGEAVESTLSDADVQNAPILDEGTTPPDTTTWPPLVVGPFGTTQSPLLLAAQFFGAGSEDAHPLPERLDRVTDWIGATVFGRDGVLGEIEGFEVDLEAGVFPQAILSVDQESHAVPFASLRTLQRDDRYVVTDLTADDLRAGITTAEAGPLPSEPPKRSWVADHG